jgi:hypothetical protein
MMTKKIIRFDYIDRPKSCPPLLITKMAKQGHAISQMNEEESEGESSDSVIDYLPR